MKIRVLSLTLLALGILALLSGVGAASESSDVTYGVSRAEGNPGIAIHWVLCDGIAPRSVDLEGYWGGSQLPTAVPVWWQIRSDAPPATGVRVETYVVGQTPRGFYQTVPLRQSLPNDLIAISGPPGDGASFSGMSFHLGDLRRDAIYRGGYVYVSPEQFARDGAGYCAAAAGSALPALGLASLGLGGVLLAGRRRPILALTAGALLAGGLVSVVGPQLDLPYPVIARQSAPAFAPGTDATASGHQVLADLSPETTRSAHGIYTARFVAPASYSFAVTCDGPSIQIGEASHVERGDTGGRQLIGCATRAVVKGIIADVGDRAELVEVVINPNRMAAWRVVVIAGGGEVGPFDEP